MIKAILFDFDGVLAKSNSLYAEAYLRIFKQNGVSVTRKQLLAHFGENTPEFVRRFAPPLKYNTILKDYELSVRTPRFYRKIKLIPGARTLLKQLKKNHSLALCTGMPENTLSFFKHQLIRGLFQVYVSGHSVKRGKPHPDLLLYTLKKLRVKPSEAIYIGDAPSDAIAARRAKIPFVAVLTGVLTRSTCERLKVKHVLPDATKLPRFLEKLN